MNWVDLIVYINFLILCYFIASSLFYTLLLFGCIPGIYKHFTYSEYAKTDVLLNSNVLPPVTVSIAFYNEEENIIHAVESALNSTYPNLYIFLINDVSTDRSMELLKEYYDLMEVPVIIEYKIKTTPVKKTYVSRKHPNLMVFDKERNGGTGDSSNIAVNACFTPYFITLDADSILKENAISEFMFDAITQDHITAVGGGVYILNGCQFQEEKLKSSVLSNKFVPLIQSVEYIRSHLFARTGWNVLGGAMGYSGTATFYDRNAVIKVGGFDNQNFAQDIEIIIHMHSYMHKNHIPYKVSFNPAAIVWTDVPRTFKEFAKQRDKWTRGILRSALKHWNLFFNPRYKIQGLLGYPAYILLEVLAPWIEFTAYISLPISYVLGIFTPYTTFLYIILAWGFISYITVANMVINLVTFNCYKKLNDIVLIFVLTAFETFGFRQYRVLISVYGTIHYFINRLRGRPL